MSFELPFPHLSSVMYVKCCPWGPAQRRCSGKKVCYSPDTSLELSTSSSSCSVRRAGNARGGSPEGRPLASPVPFPVAGQLCIQLSDSHARKHSWGVTRGNWGSWRRGRGHQTQCPRSRMCQRECDIGSSTFSKNSFRLTDLGPSVCFELCLLSS